jgi:hypothetical protein
MSIQTVIVPEVKITWVWGVPTDQSGDDTLYIDDSNIEGGRGVLPYTRIVPISGDDLLELDYGTVSKGLWSGNKTSWIKALFDKERLSKVGGNFIKCSTKSPLFGVSWEKPDWSTDSSVATEVLMLSLEVIPFASVSGLQTIYGISLPTIQNLFYSSVAYQVSRKGVAYYHTYTPSQSFGRILFAPQHTKVDDNPTKAILGAFVDVMGELAKSPEKVIISEPPVERRNSKNYSAKAYKKMQGGLAEAFGKILECGYIISVRADPSTMIDVLSWVKTI